MPFPFLDDVAHRALDGELQRLLGRLSQSQSEQHSALAGCARGIIEQAVERRLVRRGWEGSWARGEGVATAWFGDVDHDEMAAALHAVFTELVRYDQAATTPHRKTKHASQLAGAIRDYMSLRGYLLEDSELHHHDGASTPSTPAPADQISPLARAIAIMYERHRKFDRLITVKDLLKLVPDTSKAALYREPQFVAVRKAIKEMLGGRVPRGHRNDDGSVEAEDE